MAKSIKRILTLLAVALVVQYLVLPQLAGARKSLSVLAAVNPFMIVAGVFIEMAAVVAYAKLTRSLLPPAVAPGLGVTLRIQLSTQAITNVLPGGSAAGATLGYRLLTHQGVAGSDAGFAFATQGIGSALVLNSLLWLALLVSIPLSGFNPVYATAAIIGTLLLGTAAAVVILLTKGEDRASRLVGAVARPLPFVDPVRAQQGMGRLAQRLRDIASDRALLARLIGWAGINWLLRASSLWVFLTAYGHALRPDKLVVAFGLAYVLGAIPVTPGGLGVVEAILTSSLTGFGVPGAVAILGVISYRLINFWLPIPLGAAAYLSLLGKKRRDPDAWEDVNAAAEETAAKRRLAAEQRRLAKA